MLASETGRSGRFIRTVQEITSQQLETTRAIKTDFSRFFVSPGRASGRVLGGKFNISHPVFQKSLSFSRYSRGIPHLEIGTHVKGQHGVSRFIQRQSIIQCDLSGPVRTLVMRERIGTFLVQKLILERRIVGRHVYFTIRIVHAHVNITRDKKGFLDIPTHTQIIRKRLVTSFIKTGQSGIIQRISLIPGIISILQQRIKIVKFNVFPILVTHRIIRV